MLSDVVVQPKCRLIIDSETLRAQSAEHVPTRKECAEILNYG